MKYLVLLGDGMADYPLEELGGITPLQKADKPNMDYMAKHGELGLVKTVPDHLNPPGSDIANMSVLGYDPDCYYTGRSPLEAVSMGIQMSQKDLAIRCNLVTLSSETRYEDASMIDYSADEISTAEAKELILFLNEKLGSEQVLFYPGISYRHCLILRNIESAEMQFTPPHDISGRPIGAHLPQGEDGRRLFELMKQSRELLRDHPVNLKRKEKGLHTADSVWFWGQGRRPSLSNFYEKYHVRGAVVSAVDLIKGLGICAGMAVPDVPGATGNIHTNFEGKADAAISFYRQGGEFVYLHVEAPDECGHRHEISNKVRAIELIDEKILGKIWAYFKEAGEPYKIMVLPDHPTPLSLMTHTHDPVPYLIYAGGERTESDVASYDEASAAAGGIYQEKGYLLMDHFLC